MDPVDVKPANLPAKAGVYVVVACNPQGHPIKQTGEPAHSPLSGVVSVGMTGSSNTLKGRFSALARAWRPNSQQKSPSHGSRTHYNNDPQVQQAFSLAHVRLRYQSSSSAPQNPTELENLAKSHNLTVSDLRILLGCETTADSHVEAMEAGFIQWFKRAYGYIPILNRDDDGTRDKPHTEAWLDEHFADMERHSI